jgi:hypothetical protein
MKRLKVFSTQNVAIKNWKEFFLRIWEKFGFVSPEVNLTDCWTVMLRHLLQYFFTSKSYPVFEHHSRLSKYSTFSRNKKPTQQLDVFSLISRFQMCNFNA